MVTIWSATALAFMIVIRSTSPGLAFFIVVLVGSFVMVWVGEYAHHRLGWLWYRRGIWVGWLAVPVILTALLMFAAMRGLFED